MKQEHKETAQQALALVNAEIDELDGWTINSAQKNDFAAAMLRDVKTRTRQLEKKRKTITTPLNQALREVNALFRAPRERLELAEKLLKTKIAGYLETVQADNNAALEAAATAETIEDAETAIAKVQDTKAPAGVSVRYTYRPIVEDETKIDRQFLAPDMQKITAWAKKHRGKDGEPLPIAGVVFEKKPIVTSRAVKR